MVVRVQLRPDVILFGDERERGGDSEGIAADLPTRAPTKRTSATTLLDLGWRGAVGLQNSR